VTADSGKPVGLYRRWPTSLRLGSTRKFLTNSRSTGRYKVTRLTSTKCQSCVSHVQTQCTITIVSHSQIEGKASIKPKILIVTQ